MYRYLFILLFSSSLFAKDLYIIANKNFPQDSINKKDIKAIYLDQKHHINGVKLLPLNFTLENKLRSLFEKEILGKTRRYLERYWLKAHYRGHRPPKVIKSKNSLLSYIKELDNALGYIDENCSNQKDIKILYKVEIR
jgi:hypothetical protein